jgi:predicted RNase H-like nuclease
LLGAPSYRQFVSACEGSPVDWSARLVGERLNVEELLTAIRCRFGSQPEVVAVDMPLSRKPIVSRRLADNEVSRRFGARGCSTHSPSPQRPGLISDAMREQFESAGLPIVGAEPVRSGIYEVYPHISIMKLLGLDRRLPYKISRAGRDLPGCAVSEKISKKTSLLRRIETEVERELGPLGFRVPDTSSTLSALKRYEDALDAAVCAWTAWQILLGNCEPLGDADAAIWLPRF